MNAPTRCPYLCLPLCLALLGLLPACEFPLEVDTPQLNANAHAELVAYAESGSCTPGVFVDNVGGAGGKGFTRECTVQGSVYIGSSPDQVLRLSHVKEVLGFIYLTGNVDLADALPDLEKCSAISVSGYKGTRLTGPAGLREVSGLTVELTEHLQTISGFDSVKALAGLRIAKNNELVSVSGFSQLTTLVRLELEDNFKLSSFTALPNLVSVRGVSGYYTPGPISIKNCTSLLELPKFPVLTQIEDELVLMGLNATKIDGFPALKTAKSLKLNTLPNLKQLSFPELGDVGFLQILMAPALTSLSGLPKINVTSQSAICVDGVSCAELAEFRAQHTNGSAFSCGAYVACKP
ncbi:MAG: hypothetical protein ACOYOB_05050 [Myxococcota bacterium]